MRHELSRPGDGLCRYYAAWGRLGLMPWPKCTCHRLSRQDCESWWGSVGRCTYHSTKRYVSAQVPRCPGAQAVRYNWYGERLAAWEMATL